MHDSSITDWGNMYDKLQHIYTNTGGKVVVDSSFARENLLFLIKSTQDEQKVDKVSEVKTFCEETSLRKAAEWEM